MPSRISCSRRRLLGYISAAYIARMTRSFMIDQLSQEYIVAAR